MAENQEQSEKEQTENQDEVIIVEDDSIEIPQEQEQKQEQNTKKNKLFLILIAVLITTIIFMLVLLLVVVIKKKDTNPSSLPQSTTKQIQEITKKLSQKHIQKQEIQELIKKANILYLKGKKLEALKLLNKLSIYSEALSNYNLGVIKINEGKYEKALEYFNKAIANKDNRCVAAINGAYCSLKLHDKKRFRYYINLAKLYLSEESKSKSYPFYYALVHYYLGEEFESLVALNKSSNYQKYTKELKTAIYNLYNDPYNAINNTKNPFILGIEYARIGEWELAKNELSKVALAYPLKAGVAKALVELKLHEYKEAAKDLKTAKDKNNIVYPIKVIIKPSVFDTKQAQMVFKKNFLTKQQWYDLFFYYAPYKIFNITQTIDYLQKGSFGIAVDNIKEANRYLSKSANTSKLNTQMSKGIKLALNKHILKANKIFSKLIKNNPYHPILHYDLALTYAQLKNYPKAYYHFLRAYHLDAQNYLSGIFALMCAKKAGYKTDMLRKDIDNTIDWTNPKNSIYSAFLSFMDNNGANALSWIQNTSQNTKLSLVLSMAIAKQLDEKNIFTNKAIILQNMASKDIVANLLYFYAIHSTKNMKKFALEYQPLFLDSLHNWNLSSLYYGPLVAGEMYLEFAKISGQLSKVKQKLQKILLDTNDPIPVLQNLAWTDLYLKHFEESYTIFNDLIDNKGVDDYKTLFYGAVASILAGHHANAIALLSLSKRKNKNAFEARYALGLLYHEAKNLRGATIQYNKIPTNFESKFFDFVLIP